MKEAAPSLGWLFFYASDYNFQNTGKGKKWSIYQPFEQAAAPMRLT